MKMVRDSSGRFPERPFFPEGEIEGIMGQVLAAAGNPRLPGLPAVDMDMLMFNLHLEPQYTALPDGVLGATRFGSDGTPEITVSERLEADSRLDSTALHRLRTTQAHEIGHATLHAPLYVQISSSAGVTIGRLPCEASQQTRTVLYKGEWWEYQANAAMAALIMPAPDFLEQSSTWCRENRVKVTNRIRIRAKYKAFIDWMAERFCVSREAARIRAKVLGLSPE